MEILLISAYRSESIFFGLNANDKEIFLEHAFLLQKHLGMSYSDIRSLPIPYRMWFIDRLVKESKEKAQRANDNQAQNPMPQTSMHERSLFMQQSEAMSSPKPKRQPRAGKRNTRSNGPKKFK